MSLSLTLNAQVVQVNVSDGTAAWAEYYLTWDDGSTLHRVGVDGLSTRVSLTLTGGAALPSASDITAAIGTQTTATYGAQPDTITIGDDVLSGPF